MSVHELQMPVISDGTRIAYGGDQEWCRNAWYRRSGCGPTTAVNLCAWYASHCPAMRPLYAGNTEPFSREEYTDQIEELFRFITPGFMGFPYAEKFVTHFLMYARSRSVQMTGACCDKNASAEQMFDFVRCGIDTGNPVPLLILHHRAKALSDDQWHWITVSGYTDGTDGRQLIASNCGERELWPADLMFEQHPRNAVRILRFAPVACRLSV